MPDRARVSSTTFVPSVQMSSLCVPNSTELRDASSADADHVRELAFDAPLQLDALIVDLVVRVLAVPDAEAGEHAADRPGLEAALGLDRRALRAAPRERHGQPLAGAEQIDGADAAAIGEAVAVGVAEDRKEHQPVREPVPRTREIGLAPVDARR